MNVYKMAKKQDNTIWIIIAVVALIILFYGGKQGWFKFSVTQNYLTNQTIIDKLNNPPTPIPGDTCTLTINPNTITVKASITGTLTYKGLVDCQVWYKLNNQWNLGWEGKTNIDGSITKTNTLDTVGIWTFMGKCGECYTNKVDITVTEAPPVDGERDCNTDMDCVRYGRNYKCIDYVCKLTNPNPAYDEALCITTSQRNGFYGGSAITEDGYEWDSNDCGAAATSSCISQGLTFNGDDEVDANCCRWNCVGIDVNECSNLAITGGWTNFNQDPRTDQACSDICHNWCPYNPGALCMSYQFYSPNCCVWKCHIPR